MVSPALDIPLPVALVAPGTCLWCHPYNRHHICRLCSSVLVFHSAIVKLPLRVILCAADRVLLLWSAVRQVLSNIAALQIWEKWLARHGVPLVKRSLPCPLWNLLTKGVICRCSIFVIDCLDEAVLAFRCSQLLLAGLLRWCRLQFWNLCWSCHWLCCCFVSNLVEAPREHFPELALDSVQEVLAICPDDRAFLRVRSVG